jgi:predicted  nucleic acid-binding Zn-ribbon protein
MIPTWQEQAKKDPDWATGMITNQMIQEKMQEEIDALRSKVDKMQDDIVSLTDDLFSERRECLKLEKEIDELRERLEETRQLYIKQLALQKLSDIGQAIERELTNDEIMKEWKHKYENTYSDVLIDFARAILKKASEK